MVALSKPNRNFRVLKEIKNQWFIFYDTFVSVFLVMIRFFDFSAYLGFLIYSACTSIHHPLPLLWWQLKRTNIQWSIANKIWRLGKVYLNSGTWVINCDIVSISDLVNHVGISSFPNQQRSNLASGYLGNSYLILKQRTWWCSKRIRSTVIIQASKFKFIIFLAVS